MNPDPRTICAKCKGPLEKMRRNKAGKFPFKCNKCKTKENNARGMIYNKTRKGRNGNPL